MSTPIEIVRAFVKERSSYHAILSDSGKEVNAAIASVLADAERFKALERALTDDRIFVSVPDLQDDLWIPHDGTLAELADRLREVKP